MEFDMELKKMGGSRNLAVVVWGMLCALSLGAGEIVPAADGWSGACALGADDVLVLDVAEGATKAYSGRISGTGKVRKTGCGILQLTGDNSAFSGEWLVATGRVEVATTANLGAGAVKVWAAPDKNTGILYLGCSSSQTFTNPIRIMGPGAGFTLSGSSFDAYRQIHAQMSGGKAGNVVKVTLDGEITADEGCTRFWISSIGAYSGLYVNRLNVPGVDVYPVASADQYYKFVRARTVGGAICTKALYPGTASEFYSGGVRFTTDADVVCDEVADNYVCMYMNKADTFSKAGGGWPVFNLARYCNGTGNSNLDLAGKSQTFDRLIAPVRDPQYRGVAGKSCTGGRLRSNTAATVTLKGTADAETGLDVMGRVSLVWDPVDAYTQMFTNSLSDTTGSLTVQKGCLELAGVTAFSNVTTIVVADGATFRNTSTADKSLDKLASLSVGAQAIFDSRTTLRTFDGTTAITLSLASDSELYLPAEETVNVADIYIDGRRISGGSYVAGGERTFPQLKSGSLQATIRAGDYDVYTWTDGGSDAFLTTGANWKESVKPDFTGEFAGARFGEAGDEALVPDGSKIAYLEFTRPFALKPAAENAAFSLNDGLEIAGTGAVSVQSGLNIPCDQTWTVGTAKLAFSGRLSGAAEATVSVRGTSEEISFSGSGSTYPGSIAFCDAPMVKASGVNPFGGAGGTVSWSNTVSTAQMMSFSNFSTEKDVLIHSTAADYDKVTATAGDVDFKGRFTSTRSLHVKAEGNARAIFSGPSVSIAATFVAQGNGEVVVNAPLTATMIQTEGSVITFGTTGNRITHEIGINLEYLGQSPRQMRFSVAEAFDDRTTLTLKAVKSYNGAMDLCGFNQTFGTLTMLAPDFRRPTQVAITNSGEQATLHIVQKNERARSDYPLAWIAGVIAGPIDFWKSGPASTVVSNHIEAVGALKVTHAGMVFAANDGSWRNATSVQIADDPTEAIRAGEEPFIEVRANNALGRNAELTISGTGRLRIAAGVVQTVNACVAGGVKLGAGSWRHGATHSSAQRTTPYIDGEGTLVVKGGLLIIFQ